MKDEDRTKEQLVNELLALRQQVTELQTLETERKKVEEELHLQGEIIANMAEGVLLTRASDRMMVYANPRFEEMFDYGPGELIGKNVSMLNAPGERTSEGVAKEIIKQLDENGVWYGEVNNIKKDSTRFWCRASISTFEHPVYGEVDVNVLEDITERKRAEEELRESEERYRQLVELSPDTVAVHNEGKVVFINPAGVRLLKAESRDQILGKPILDFLHPDYRQVVGDRIQAVIQEQIKAPLIEEKFIRLDGTTVDVEVTSVPITWEGKPAMQAIARDITERKRVEEVLLENKNHYVTASRLANIGYWDRDFVLNMANWSNETCSIFGVDPDEFHPTWENFLSIVHPSDREQLSTKVQASLKSGKPLHVEYRIIRPDGMVRDVHSLSEVQLNENGQPVRLIGSLQDITERKEAEQALRESEEKFAKASRSSPSPMIITTLADGRLIDVNVSFAYLHGYHREEVIGHTLAELGIWVKAEENYRVAQMLRERGAVRDLEVELRTKSGEQIVGIFSAETINLGGEQCVITAVNDITERKRAEEALRESHNYLERLTNSMWDAVFLVKIPERIIEWANDSFRFIGYDPEECLGRTTEFLYPDRDSFLDFGSKLQNAVAAGQGILYTEQLLKRKSGDVFPAEITATIIRNEEGEVVSITSIVRDITERKRAETQLRESEEKLRLMFESVTDGITVTDLNGIVIDANTRTAEIHGFGCREETLGRSAFEFIAPYDHERAMANMQKTVEDGSIRSIEYTLRRADGSEFPGELSASLIKDANGNPFSFIAITRDITERKETEELYRTLVSSSPAGIHIIQDGKFVFVNTQVQKDLDFTADELLGTDPSQYVYPEDREQLREAVVDMLKGKRSAPYEFRLIGRGGEIIWVLGTATSIHYNGKPARLENLLDVTERKQAEEELKRSHQELRNLSTYLQSVREAERTGVAREIHDELGQSLTALKMDISWLSKNLLKDEEPLVEKTQAMSMLIDTTIRTVKRMSTKLRPGVLDDLGLAAAIEWQAEEFQNRTGIKCQLSLEHADLVPDKERATTIFRIFQEALTNVARHAKASRVRVSLKERAEELLLQIRDNGKGITEEQISASESFGLMGMRERAHYWGGEFKITGITGKGTTIEVSLPLDRKGETK